MGFVDLLISYQMQKTALFYTFKIATCEACLINTKILSFSRKETMHPRKNTWYENLSFLHFTSPYQISEPYRFNNFLFSYPIRSP